MGTKRRRCLFFVLLPRKWIIFGWCPKWWLVLLRHQTHFLFTKSIPIAHQSYILNILCQIFILCCVPSGKVWKWQHKVWPCDHDFLNLLTTFPLQFGCIQSQRFDTVNWEENLSKSVKWCNRANRRFSFNY